MKTQSVKASRLPLLIAGVGIVLFSTAGVARMMGWGAGSTGDPRDIPALGLTDPVPATSQPRARPRCPECGVIVSRREIEKHDRDPVPRSADGPAAGNGDKTRVKSIKSYEFTVRMADGSSRVSYQASPGNWRSGERVIVIGNTGPTARAGDGG